MRKHVNVTLNHKRPGNIIIIRGCRYVGSSLYSNARPATHHTHTTNIQNGVFMGL